MRLFSTETRRDRLVNLFLTLPIFIAVGSAACAAFVVIVKDRPWSDFHQVLVIIGSVMFVAYVFHVARMLISSKGTL